MSQLQINLKLYEQGHDTCRVYYKSNAKLYAFVELERGSVTPHVCTPDGEPCYPVNFNKVKAVFELPTGDSKVEILVRAWIKAYEKTE